MLKSIFFICCVAVNAKGFSQSVSKKNNVNSNQYFLNSLDLIKKNKIEEAEESIKFHLNEQQKLNDKIQSYYKIAIAYNNALYYNLSLEYAFEAIKYLDTSTYLRSELYQVIIINHIDLTNYDLAESYYWKTVSLHNKRENVKANDNNLIGEIYRLKGEFKKSIPFYHKAIQINKLNKFEESLAINYNNIGLSHLYSNTIDSANYYLNLSNLLIKNLQLTNRESTINSSYGELYVKAKKFEKALLFFQKTIAYDLSNHPDEYEVYQDAYKGMNVCYKKLGDYENALNSYVKYHEYKTKILDYKKNTSILQKQILSDRKIHNKELDLIKTKLDLEIKNKLLISVVLTALLFIVVLVIVILRIRNKRIKQKVELEINKNRIQELELDKMKLSKEQVEHKLIQSNQNQKIKELESIRLEEQIQSKNRELTSTAIHLMSKNEILIHIQEKLNQIKNQDDNSRAYNDIKFLISDSLRLDDDWNVFKKHFTDVNPQFLENLKIEFPTITTDELKLCAYLKIQLSSKEIARLINVSIDAVNKRRNRLRKKLQITSDEDFYGFFLNY